MPNVSIISDDDKQLSTFVVEKDLTLFDALEKQGTKLPHGCLSGSCGACRIQVLTAPENLESPSLIEQNTIASLYREYCDKLGPEFKEKVHLRLGCRAKIKGDISFKVIK